MIKDYKKEKSLKKSMLINMLVKPISYVISFFYTPLLLEYFGDEKYGLWATILSIVTWINFCDVGIGNGLRNILTRELENKDYTEIKKSISTAYVILGVVATGLILLIIIVSYFINWKLVLNTTYEIRGVLVISFSIVALNFVLGLGKTILFCLQFSECVSYIELASGILQLLGLIILGRFVKGSFLLVAIILGISSSCLYLFTDVVLARYKSYFAPSLSCYDRKKAKELFSNGLLFLILQLGGIAMTSTDYFLVSHYYGSTAVTPYSTVARLLSAVFAVYVAFISPIWSKTALEKEKNNYKWIGKMTLLLSGIMVMVAMLFIVIGIFYKPIAFIWLRKNLIYETGLIAISVASVIFEMMTATFSSILNGLNVLKIQALIAIIQVVANIPLSIGLAQWLGFGVVGIKLSTMGLFALSSVVYAVVLIKTISKMKKEL